MRNKERKLHTGLKGYPGCLKFIQTPYETLLFACVAARSRHLSHELALHTTTVWLWSCSVLCWLSVLDGGYYFYRIRTWSNEHTNQLKSWANERVIVCIVCVCICNTTVEQEKTDLFTHTIWEYAEMFRIQKLINKQIITIFQTCYAVRLFSSPEYYAQLRVFGGTCVYDYIL